MLIRCCWVFDCSMQALRRTKKRNAGTWWDRYLLQKLRANATWIHCEQRTGDDGDDGDDKFLVNLPVIRWIDADGESETVKKLNSLHGSSPKWTFFAISCTAFVHALFFLFMFFFWCSESVLNCIWGHVFSLDTDDKVAAKLNLASWQLHMPIGCSTILIRVEGSDGLGVSCSVFLGFSFLFWILLASWQPWHMTKDENVHFLANSDWRVEIAKLL